MLPKHTPAMLVCLFLLVCTTVCRAESPFTADELASTCELTELDTPIKPVRQDKPELPASLQDTKASVQVAFIISETGTVTGPRIVTSTNAAFNDIALATVSKWTFEKGTSKGAPVRVRVVVPMRFNMSGRFK